MIKSRPCVLVLWLGLVAAPAVFAQTDDGEPALSAEQQQALAAMREFWESLDRQTGDVALGDDLVTLSVPDDFYYLGPDDAERVLVDVWGNPPDQGKTLGMLFPAQYTPFDPAGWAVTIDYSDDGHVSDSDAAGIDYDELLAQMKSDVHSANADRVDAGFEPVELVGWAETPHYDAASRKLYWAKELRFGESPDDTLNYEIRVLGRKGILSMTFVAAADQLAEINDSLDSVLAMAEFNPGQRYEDFDSSIDKVAAYGIGALIAGKVAAKAGLFAAGLLLLKKVGVFVAVGFAALARKFKGLFARSAAS
jgi:uncharacterized membrane-anchored protein